MLQHHALLVVGDDLLGDVKLLIVVVHAVCDFGLLTVEHAKDLLVLLYFQVCANVDSQVAQGPPVNCVTHFSFPLLHGIGHGLQVRQAAELLNHLQSFHNSK